MKVVIHWFRRDLRLADNTALYKAYSQSEKVVPVFCWDEHILTRPDVGPPRVWFLLHSLKELSDKIAGYNGRLIILNGKPEVEIPALASRIKAEAVFFNRDYEPYALKRDSLVRERLSEAGVECCSYADLLLAEPDQVATPDGRPFSVFTPFSKAWHQVEKKLPCPIVDNFGGSVVGEGNPFPDLTQLKYALSPEFDTTTWTPGENAANARLADFNLNAVERYPARRDLPAIDGTSRLSPYLKFGNISIRSVYQATQRTFKFVQELAWREFYFHVLWHWPQVENQAWQETKRNMQWDDNPELLQKWIEGRTGYPIVDAGMRQLLADGWMHNRVRMIVASFLTKDLHLNWQDGERHFMLKLVDGDLAPNNGGWQWAASTGVDPRPLRIFNPWLQSEKFDSKGEYIRRWVSELTEVPLRHIHQPHLMTTSEQDTCGVQIGRDYPSPMVDHAEERKVALLRYQDAKQDLVQGSLFPDG